MSTTLRVTGALAAFGIATALAACGSSVPSSARPTTSTSPTTSTTTSVPATAAPTTSGAPTTAPPTTAPAGFRYQPLWPFRDEADAASWQTAYRQGGHQPWHLDADETALSFTTGFLGFREVDRVVSHHVGATDARVAVGYANDGHVATAAVVHLVKIGHGADAPWEVVGTDDTGGLTLTSPAYGSSVTSPVTVGGSITGVDENLHVRILQLGPTPVVGESCCTPAGGDHTPWHLAVSFQGATGSALTVVVSTGGHVQGVERFAVTGARAAT